MNGPSKASMTMGATRPLPRATPARSTRKSKRLTARPAASVTPRTASGITTFIQW